jgi:GntR family carbon starvation induced transcriptional regulator
MKQNTGSSAESATQRAYHALRKLIMTSAIAPGEKLKVDTLKARLNTGASPIREALSLLTSDHLVERIDQRGFVAAACSKGNFQEILKLRCSLEDMALRESIKSSTTEWMEELVLAHHRVQKADRNDVEEFERIHKAFHMALLANCGSKILLRLCDQLYDLNIRYRYIAGHSLNYGKRDVMREHSEILAAALDNDEDLASSRLMYHYRETGRFLEDTIA